MIYRNSSVKKIIFICALLDLFLLFYLPLNGNEREWVIWIIVYITGLLVEVMFFVGGCRYNIDIFEPVLLISIVYFAFLIFAPIRCIYFKSYDCLGVDVMNGAVGGTIVFGISMLCYYLGYWNKFRIAEYAFVKEKALDSSDYISEQRIAFGALIIWVVCCGLTLLYDFSVGRTLIYMFSFGKINTSLGELRETGGNINLLINFEYSMIGAWMYLFRYSRIKCVKAITFVLTLSLLFVRGFRFIILIFVLAPIIYTYMRKDKRPAFTSLLLFAIVAILAFSMIETVRNSVRSGDGYHYEITSVLYAFNRVFDSDFTVFKPFYGIIEHFPKDMPFQYGKEMLLYTFVMIIPRVIWPGKPDALQKMVVTTAVSETAAQSGMAFVNLGEFYFEFGILGCIVSMFLFGVLSRYLRRIAKINSDGLICYSMLLPTCIQLVARGYIPSNFYLIVFLCLPTLIIRFIAKRI